MCRDTRAEALEESLTKLGVERLNKDDVQKMQWDVLEPKIGNWVHYMRIAVRRMNVIFHFYLLLTFFNVIFVFLFWLWFFTVLFVHNIFPLPLFTCFRKGTDMQFFLCNTCVVFTHGQLYIACSRVHIVDGVKIYISRSSGTTPCTSKMLSIQKFLGNFHKPVELLLIASLR